MWLCGVTTGYAAHVTNSADATLFSSSDFRELRRNKEAYTIFHDYFLPAVVQHRIWRRRVHSWIVGSDLCTVSDEAFALLILENYEAIYKDLFALQQPLDGDNSTSGDIAVSDYA